LIDQQTAEATLAKKKKATLEEMRQEADRRQDNLASDIDELLDRVNPKNAVSRWANETVAGVKEKIGLR
jgi:predicted metal-dependent hydrolase